MKKIFKIFVTVLHMAAGCSILLLAGIYYGLTNLVRKIQGKAYKL